MHASFPQEKGSLLDRTEQHTVDGTSDSDVDIEDASPSHVRSTAAWIQQQLCCPEPFLTAPELLLARAEGPHAGS